MPMSDLPLPRRHQLHWHLMRAFALVTTVPLLLILSITLLQMRTQTEQQVINQLEAIAELKHDQIQRWLTASAVVLEGFLAEDHHQQQLAAFLDAPTDRQDQGAIEETLQALLTLPTTGAHFDLLFLYDPLGQVVAASTSTEVGKVVANQPYFSQSLTGAYLQPPYYTVGRRTLTMLLTRPIYDARGQTVGVLAGRVQLGELIAIMQVRTGLGDSGETYLVSSENNYLLTPSRFADYPQNRSYQSYGIDQALQGRNGSGVYTDYRTPPVQVIGAYRWIPSLQAALVAEIDEREAQHRFTQTAVLSGSATLALGVLAAGIGQLVARRVSQPIKALAETATHISRGALHHRVTLPMYTELRVLAEAFNQMADHLHHTLSELEQRVIERTAALAAEQERLSQEIADRHVLEATLQHEHTFLQVVLTNLADGIIACDPTGTPRLLNQAARTIYGLSDEALPPATWSGWYAVSTPEGELCAPPPDNPIYWAFHGEPTPPTELIIAPTPWAARMCVMHGHPLYDAQGQLAGAVVTLHDLTAQKQAESLVHFHASHDGLTGLPNRAEFLDRVQRAIDHAHYDPTYLFAILLLDLDRFNIINDSLGHLMGDALLIAVAQRIAATLHRPGDMVARFGGDDYAIFVDDLKAVSDITRFADRLQLELAYPFQLHGHDIVTSASIGIGLWTPTYTAPEELLRDADMALYRAKVIGKARYAVFDTSMHAQMMTRLHLEIDLRRAVERNEVSLHYQPIMALVSGTVYGVEALLRWRHPQHGMIAPADFIPIAEETGLIIPLGWWVLEEVCRQLKQWFPDPAVAQSIIMSINLSSKQVAQPDSLERITNTLQHYGVPAAKMTLEMTEHGVIENTEAAARLLRRCQSVGMHIALDDFGIGYSSLNYLHELPIDILKIDRSFIQRMQADPKTQAIIRTIIAFAETLDIMVIAEGIETEAQRAMLLALGCRYGQGYFFARPMDGATAGSWLADRQVGVVANNG